MPNPNENYDGIWNEALDLIRATPNLSNVTISLWFEEIKIALIEENDVHLVQKYDFKREILIKNHIPLLEEVFCKILNRNVRIHIYSSEKGRSHIPSASPYNIDQEKVSERKSENHTYTEQIHIVKTEDKKNFSNTIVPDDIYTDKDHIIDVNADISIPIKKNDYTFENFITGSSNKLAHAACKAVAESPAKNYNPLFVYGPSGVGKTHLLWAIINEISEKNSNTNIIYVRGDDFTNQMVTSILKKKTEQFRDKYRHADVLLIDDIQFIAGKETTQEEFFHTFNALYEKGKQIIMTSDRPPKDIKTLEDRLKSRFEWGLTADIQPPDYELRMAIIQKKAEIMDIDLKIDVAQLLAENLKSNIRQIEGAIVKLRAQSFLTGAPITTDLAYNCIADLITGSEPVSVTVDRILDKVSAKYEISIEDIKSRKKTKNIAFTRHIAIYLIRKLTNMSLPAIGKVIGRDHSTIIFSLEKIEAEMALNPSFENELNDLIKQIKE